MKGRHVGHYDDTQRDTVEAQEFRLIEHLSHVALEGNRIFFNSGLRGSELLV